MRCYFSRAVFVGGVAFCTISVFNRNILRQVTHPSDRLHAALDLLFDDDNGGCLSFSSELAIEHCQGQMTQITKSIVFGIK